MQIIKRINNNTIEIRGFITTIKNIEDIQKEIEKHIDESTITLKIIDSFTIPSILISYLIRLHSLQNKNIILEMKDEGLYELLKDLDLKKIFTLKKI
jgi:hypothetical protein